MDDRAYHLQSPARRAVAQALAQGRLARQPCEVCGDRSQAHHDSYYPDRWLEVRWLCAKHHRAWHATNQPGWRDFYEHHRSDSEGVQKPGGGRPSKPWYRTGSARWYVKVDGKAHNLGPCREEAFRKVRELIENRVVAPNQHQTGCER